MTVATEGEASTCWHESHHVASAICDGMTPRSVIVDPLGLEDRGNERTVGRMHQAFKDYGGYTDRNLRCHVVALLLGTMCHGLETQARIECWPIEVSKWQDRNCSDARHIKLIADELEFDQVDWGRAVFQARERAGDRRFKLLVRAISAALEERGELSRDDLIKITNEVDDNG